MKFTDNSRFSRRVRNTPWAEWFYSVMRFDHIKNRTVEAVCRVRKKHNQKICLKRCLKQIFFKKKIPFFSKFKCKYIISEVSIPKTSQKYLLNIWRRKVNLKFILQKSQCQYTFKIPIVLVLMRKEFSSKMTIFRTKWKISWYWTRFLTVTLLLIIHSEEL